MLSGDAKARREFAAIYFLPVILINLGNVAAYLFQLVLGRSMSAADFGTFNAVFALVLVATAPMGVLHLVVAHVAISRKAQGFDTDGPLLRRCLSVGVAAALLLLVLGLPFISTLARQFETDRSTIVAALITVGLSFLWPVPAGLIQASGGYVGFAAILSSLTVSRLLGGVALVSILGLGTSGAMWACALSLVIAVFLGLWMQRGQLVGGDASLPFHDVARDGLRFGWPQLLTALLTAALTNLDVAFVRLLDAPDVAGLYAGASVIGRIGLLLPGALTGIIFVEAARNRTGSQQLLLSLGLAAALATCVLLPVLVAPRLILDLLLGARFHDAASLLQITTAAMCCMAVAQSAMMYLLGRRTYSYMAVLGAGVAGFLVCVWLMRPDAMGIAWLLLTFNSLVLVGCVAMAFVVARREQKASTA